MHSAQRQTRITEEISMRGAVSVSELSRLLQVTQETVRRDLDSLEHAKVLRRVHGGAVAAHRFSSAESALSERHALRTEEKEGIATRALRDLLPANFRGSILLDAGSSTRALAELLAEWQPETDRRIDILTNSPSIAMVLDGNTALDISILGGRIRGMTGAAVGPGTIGQLASLRVDLGFIGVNGVSSSFGLSTPDSDEAAVKAQMVRSSRRVVVLADHSKFDQESLVRFADFGEVDALYTDAPTGSELSVALDEAGVEVVWA